jgi:hypothetical protein
LPTPVADPETKPQACFVFCACFQYLLWRTLRFF